MRAYCTYFDSGYVTRGLALHESIVANEPGATLHVLCLDQQVEAMLESLSRPGLVPHPVRRLEELDPELRGSRGNRSVIEYYFTCGPSLLRYLFANEPSIDELAYIDADMFLFSSAGPAFREMGSNAVGIVEHRFPPFLREREKYGKFNVGFMIFRRSGPALSCIDWWRERCIEWCFDRLEGARFADQKYLERWPELFEFVVVLRHPGINVAPWNVAGHEIRAEDDTVTIDGVPLIAFHFHGLRQLLPWIFDSRFANYRTPLAGAVRGAVYPRYVAALRRAASAVTATCPTARARHARRTVSLSDRVSAAGFRALVDGVRFRQYFVSPGRSAL